MKRLMLAYAIATTFMATAMPGASDTSTDGQAIEVAIPKHGKLCLKVPATWKYDIRQPPGDLPPTIILRPGEGDDFKTLLTPLWSPKGDQAFNKPEEVKRSMDFVRQRMLPGAVEDEVTLMPIKGGYGTGYYFLVTDRAPKPGEYPYAVQAGIGVGDLRLSVTILCRSKDSVGIGETIKALETATQKGDQGRQAGPAANSAPEPRRQPAAKQVTEGKPGSDYKLSAIMRNNGKYTALLNGEMYATGDKLGQGKIINIDAKVITIETATGGTVTLSVGESVNISAIQG
jgi:hypothetical protein